jgi:hypothetical protein
VNGLHFEGNYLDYVLSLVSAALAIFLGLARKRGRSLKQQYAAVAEDHDRLSLAYKALVQEHTRLGVEFRSLSERREQLVSKLEAADRRNAIQTIVGSSVAQVLETHRNGRAIASAIRAVAKEKGVLEDFETLLGSAREPAPSTDG